MSELYKHECGLYVHDTEQASIDEFGQAYFAKGDIIYNTMRKIIDDFDQSTWAYYAILHCGDLLLHGKRWDDIFNHPLDADNWFEYQWSHFAYKQGWIKQRKYRSQRSLTRDPYIYLYAACKILNRAQFIGVVQIPWYLYINSPVTYFWRRYLITGKGKWLYEMLEHDKPNGKDYVKLLVYYRRLAANVKAPNKG